jgi:hypothetical protein
MISMALKIVRKAVGMDSRYGSLREYTCYSERLFMDEFREKKYHPEYLFNDLEIVDRLSRHAMAIWKMQNADE